MRELLRRLLHTRKKQSILSGLRRLAKPLVDDTLTAAEIAGIDLGTPDSLDVVVDVIGVVVCPEPFSGCGLQGCKTCQHANLPAQLMGILRFRRAALMPEFQQSSLDPRACGVRE